jgi:HPt (histidine-containing phosphotransfer) domain-containing protein
MSDKPADKPPAAAVVLNLDRALGRLLGNTDLLGWMVHQFRDEGPKGRQELGEAIERKDLAATAYAAHRLRGQALAIEALALAEALDRIEQTAWQGKVDALDGLRGAAERELDRVLEALATIPPPSSKR